MNKKNNLTQNEEIFELVRRAQKRDEKAFAELMRRYERVVYYLILKMVKNETDAQDLTVEVFTKVFMNIDMYAEIHSFSTWLLKIASNHAIDFLRKKKKEKNTVNIDKPLDEETNWFMEIASDEPNPERKLIISQHYNELNKIIEELPDQISIILKMRLLEEMSYKEIAEELDIAIGTVKARIHRGRRLLMAILNKKK